jgi:transcriptional regulatory protein RtcR
VGATQDAGEGATRWRRWRPSVALTRHPSLPVARLELLHEPRHAELARQVAADVREVSPGTEVVLRELPPHNPWDFAECYGALSRFAAGYVFKPDDEEYLVHITTGTHIAQICLFLLTETRDLPGCLLQTAPPPKGNAGEPGTCAVIDLDLARYDAIAARFAERAADEASYLTQGIETRNPAMRQLVAELARVAVASTAPILLTGPTGAGKSEMARRIYRVRQQRGRLRGPLVEVNCATLRGDLAMSALFGHVRGAFTGAETARGGFLKAADRGLLFLDEIAELGTDEQAMLLRAVEDKVFYPVGGEHPVRSDFQLIAGTNRPLVPPAFRDDLLARVDVWTFRLPGLAERPEDVEPNLDFELLRSGEALRRRASMNKQARAAFLAFATGPEGTWPGNFRDLSACVLRMATLARGARITLEDVEVETARLRAKWGALAAPDVVTEVLGREGAARLDLFDRLQLRGVIEVCRECASLSEAGRRLFQASRLEKASVNDADRLRKYLGRFGLDFERVAGG